MKKRVVSLLLAAALMIGALAGCGSDSKDGESESVTESARNESVTSVRLLLLLTPQARGGTEGIRVLMNPVWIQMRAGERM